MCGGALPRRGVGMMSGFLLRSASGPKGRSPNEGQSPLYITEVGGAERRLTSGGEAGTLTSRRFVQPTQTDHFAELTTPRAYNVSLPLGSPHSFNVQCGGGGI